MTTRPAKPSNRRRFLNLVTVPAALSLALPAFAECDGMVRLPLVSQSEAAGEQICEWRTEAPWAPPETCGNKGFEVVGWGDRPGSVELQRSNSGYKRAWETEEAEPTADGDPAWTTNSLAVDDTFHRCAAGWCEPVGYIFRTVEPAPPEVCGQQVELRVRTTDEVE